MRRAKHSSTFRSMTDLIYWRDSASCSFSLLSCFILWSAALFSLRWLLSLWWSSAFYAESLSSLALTEHSYFYFISSWVSMRVLSLRALATSPLSLDTYFWRSSFSSFSLSPLLLYYFTKVSFRTHYCLYPRSISASALLFKRAYSYCFSLSSSSPMVDLCFSMMLSFLSMLSRCYFIFLS